MKRRVILLALPLLVITTAFSTLHIDGLNSKSSCEDIFVKQAEACLNEMEAVAQNHSQAGVAVIAFIPGEKTESWVSRMKVVGTLNSKFHNFLGVASAKAAEMALTLQNSGNGSRKPLIGELGYKGGVIKKIECGYLIASFSGAPAKIDAEISKHAIDFLSKYY